MADEGVVEYLEKITNLQDTTVTDADKTGLSDSDEESEIYDPMPYAFVLKDVYRKPLILSPEKIYNARIQCPSFHILLDHTISVLWLFYSGRGHRKLGTSQLHWAIKFLEGLVNERNQHTPDIAMAIEHLQNALLEAGASLDEEKISKRNYDDENPLDYSLLVSLNLSKQKDDVDYLDFAKDLIDRKGNDATILETPSGIESILEKSKRDILESLQEPTKAQTPSIVLNDILENDPKLMIEMLENAVREIKTQEIQESLSGSSMLLDDIKAASSGLNALIAQEGIDAKNNLIKNAMTQLERILDLLGNLDKISINPSPEETAKLKEMLKNF